MNTTDLTRLLFPLALAASSAALCGCGDDAGGDDDDDGGSNQTEVCHLSVELSGGLTASLDYGQTEGCSGSSTDASTSLSWGGFTEDTPTNFALSIDGSTKAAASNLPATVSIISEATSWSTPQGACSVSITSSTLGESDDIGTDYLLEGTGTCTGAAVDSTGGAADVTIGPFEFRDRTLFPS